MEGTHDVPGLMEICPPLLFACWRRYWQEVYNRPDKATAYLQQIDVTLRAVNAKDSSSVRWTDSRIPEPVYVPLTDGDGAGSAGGKLFPWERGADGKPSRPSEAELIKRERIGALSVAVAPGPDGRPRAGSGKVLQMEVRTRTRAEAAALNIPLPPLPPAVPVPTGDRQPWDVPTGADDPGPTGMLYPK